MRFDRRVLPGMLAFALLTGSCGPRMVGDPVPPIGPGAGPAGSGGAAPPPMGPGQAQGQGGQGGAAPAPAGPPDAAAPPAPGTDASPAGPADVTTMPAVDAGAPGMPQPPSPGRLFGSHPTQYPADTIRPTGEITAIDGAVAAFYDRWKAAYLTRGCEGVYVKAPAGNGATSRITSSQMHGLGMLAVVTMAGHDPEAQVLFDGMFALSRKVTSYLQRRPNRAGNDNLMGYGIDARCAGLADGDASTDGDLAIAQALLMADRQWGSPPGKDYLAQAKLTLGAIKTYEMNPRSKTPLLGDWCSLPDEPAQFQNATNPAHFALDHFRAFARASGDAFWTEASDAVYALVAGLQMRNSPTTGLLPAYVLNTTGTAAPAVGMFLSEPNAGAYTPASAFILLRFASDYVVSGDVRAKQALAKVNPWIQGLTMGDPGKVTAGYRLNGSALSSDPAPELEAAFAAAALVDGSAANRAWLDASWQRLTAAPLTTAYADTVRLHGMIVISGNHWVP